MPGPLRPATNREKLSEGLCRVGREVSHPGPSPDPDKEISTIRLFRRYGSRPSSPDGHHHTRNRSATFRSCGDMRSNVEALDMVPSESSYPHGLPLLDRVRVATPFPGVGARMQPSDSPAASAAASVVPRRRPTTTRTLFSEPAVRAFADARRVGGLGAGSSAAPVGFVDRQGPPRLLGHPRPTRHGQTPRRGAAPPRPLTVSSPAAFRVPEPLGPRMKTFSGLTCSWLTGLLAYASTAALPLRWQGWLPTCRAKRWSGGIRTRWMTNGSS